MENPRPDLGKQKLTVVMRRKARRLHDKASALEQLANQLDAIEDMAHSINKEGDTAPYIGAGSAAEWILEEMLNKMDI